MARRSGSNAPDTRARILDAALGCFGERGFAGTSIRDLAERAGMTTAALYYHFASKDQILEALFAPCLDTFRGIADADLVRSPRIVIEELFDLFESQGAAIQAVMNDRSAMRHISESSDFRAVMGRVTHLIAGGKTETDLIRASCALGALQRGVATAPTRTSRTSKSDDATRRSTIVAAALGALESRP